MKYRSLEQVLIHLKLQVIESLPAAAELNIQGTPAQIFNQLKSILVYRRDPNGVELLQELETVLNWNGRNRHGIDGAGDCDCMTIAAISVLYNAGYKNLYITLAGRNVHNPVHIFAGVYSYVDNRYYNFDLTEPEINKKRFYPFYQTLKINIP